MASHITNLLKQLPFYGKTIKSIIKKNTNAKLLSELPFFEKPKKAKIKQLTIKKLLQEQPFYKQLIKNHILKNLATKNYYVSYHFMKIFINSLIKTAINRRYHLNDSFQEILNLLDIWINEGSGWVIDKIEGLYINVADYEPLLGRSYILLPKVLNNSMKSLINLKNEDHKCFM